MYNILKNKEVKIRKPRKCFGCLDIVPIGRIMTYVVGVEDGVFGTTYWCDLCDAYFHSCSEFAEDGISEGEFRNEMSYNQFKKEYLCQERKVLFEKDNLRLIINKVLNK